MDGENNGKPYEQMDDLGGKNSIFGSAPIFNSDLKKSYLICTYGPTLVGNPAWLGFPVFLNLTSSHWYFFVAQIMKGTSSSESGTRSIQQKLPLRGLRALKGPLYAKRGGCFHAIIAKASPEGYFPARKWTAGP